MQLLLSFSIGLQLLPAVILMLGMHRYAVGRAAQAVMLLFRWLPFAFRSLVCFCCKPFYNPVVCKTLQQACHT